MVGGFHNSQLECQQLHSVMFAVPASRIVTCWVGQLHTVEEQLCDS